MRNRRPKEIDPIIIPSDFIEGKVRLFPSDGPLTRGDLRLSGSEAKECKEGAAGIASLESDGGRPNGSHSSCVRSSPADWPQYSLNRALMSELLATLAAGLAPVENDSQDTFSALTFAKQKAHLQLLCPIDGGIYFLDKVVENAAFELGADIISLDPQTLAELAGEYIKEGLDTPSDSLWTLGYDTAQVFHRPSASTSAEDEAASEESLEEEQDRESTLPFSPRVQSTVIPFSQAPVQLQDAIKSMFMGGGNPSMSPRGGGRAVSKGAFQASNPHRSLQWNEMKLGALLDTLIGSATEKNKMRIESDDHEQPGHSQTPLPNHAASDSESKLQYFHLKDEPMKIARSSSEPPPPSNEQAIEPINSAGDKKIVLLKDFKEMRSTFQGRKLVDKLVEIIQKKRLDGERVVLVGTTSSADLAVSHFNRIENLQSGELESCFRTLIISPGTDRGLYHLEENRRTREINGKHIYSMIKSLGLGNPGTGNVQDSSSFVTHLHSVLKGSTWATYLDEQILSLDEVHRLVFTASGQRNLQNSAEPHATPFDAKNIIDALELIEKSDAAKTAWAQNEHQLQNPPDAAVPQAKRLSAFDVRMKKIRKTCNQHEKNLLRGVVDPESINIAFSDVHASPDTIEALKTLTTLSLRRPDAFKYGVLAKDKINGLLLYGPPGTGKTLLAKAVTKESGATILEVSGSDVYDMYVGEGEKNVRAVFSLAKKLAPCVVFIDEADAIFASRGSGTNRNSHRELINQFLREWDGMHETSAFIMVATNRPFDLDDAALRRLPRRLLVDLPSEKDREAILNIHLNGETLAEDVSLPKLASKTPLYSGSDLKNLAVAAALAAVREENDEAAKHEVTRLGNITPVVNEDGSDVETAEPYRYPEKRILRARHFDKAMEEISASVSEDMGSLGAIRKFDEKYGDRRGRKKKAAYGFSAGGGPELKEELESVKVRS